MEDQNFDEKFATKLRTMIISNEREMVNIAKEIFEELKVEIIDFAPTIKLAREKLILGADKLLPYNFILIINSNKQYSDENLTNPRDILGKIRCDKLYLNTPIIVVEDDLTSIDQDIMEQNKEVNFMDTNRYKIKFRNRFCHIN